jgi:hypothetical protein
MPGEQRDSSSPALYTFETSIRRFAEFLISTLFAKAGAPVVAAAAVYVSVISFEESSSSGIRSVIFFLIPTLWGAFWLVSMSRTARPLEDTGKVVVPVLGIVAGIVISAAIVISAPVSTSNIGLGVMEGFYFMANLSSDRESERQWGLALLLMVTVIAITVAVTA